MNILIITPRIPYPPFRGDKLKIFNISKNLSRNNSVTILTFYRNDRQMADIPKLEKNGIKVELVRLSVFESLFQFFLAFLNLLPFQVAWYKSSKMKKKVGEMINQNNYDVVYYHLIRSAQYICNNRKNSQINVLDFTDAVSLYLTRFEKIVKNPIKKFLLRIEKNRIEKYEKIAEKFHTLFLCSEIDRDFIVKRGFNVNTRLLKNGIDTSYFKSEAVEFDRNRIIFTGNMPYFANYDAAIFFSKEIFPLILRKVPEAKFYIVGQKPPKKIVNLGSDNIIVTGFVPDIKKEYLKSAVNVAPIRFGAGTLNKVIESIVLGVPVVSTSMAAGGLPEELKKYIFISDDKETFAKYVADVILNPNIRTELMQEGKEIIEKLLSWEVIVDEFENYLKESIRK